MGWDGWDGTGRDSRDLPNYAEAAGSIPVGSAGEARAELARSLPGCGPISRQGSSEVEAAPTLFFLTEACLTQNWGRMDARPRFEVLQLSSAGYLGTESPALERVQQ